MLFVLKGLSPSGRRRVEQIYRDASLQNRVETLRNEWDIRGGIEFALSKADSYIREALRAIEAMPAGACRSSLETMAEYVLCRKW